MVILPEQKLSAIRLLQSQSSVGLQPSVAMKIWELSSGKKPKARTDQSVKEGEKAGLGKVTCTRKLLQQKPFDTTMFFPLGEFCTKSMPTTPRATRVGSRS